MVGGPVVSACALRALLGDSRRIPSVHSALRARGSFFRPGIDRAFLRWLRRIPLRHHPLWCGGGSGWTAAATGDHAPHRARANLGIADRPHTSEPHLWLLGTAAGCAVARRD